MDDVTNGNIDIYAEFGVNPDALRLEIARKYRQLALQYHPDKNSSPEAGEKFRFFAAINTVLQDTNLRRQYDEIRQQKMATGSKTGAGNVGNQIQQFKEQLRRREYEAQLQKAQEKPPKSRANVEVLAMQGLRLRRETQAKMMLGQGYVSYKSLDVPVSATKFLVRSPKLEVTWKFRPESGAQIDSETLRRIMSRFGPVLLCSVLGNDGLYAKGLTEFEFREDAQKAFSYEYKSARLWDGTPVRKLASLLRGVKWAETGEYSSLGETDVMAEINGFLHGLNKENGAINRKV